MNRLHLQSKVCPVCGKQFHASRYDAKYCSGKCRTKASRGRKTGQGNGWYAVRPEFKDAFMSHVDLMGNDAQRDIEEALIKCGATCAEWAIAAVCKALDYRREVEISYQ